MSDWGQENEDLFRAARPGLSPSRADRERVRARIAAKLGGAALGAAVGASAAGAAGKGAGAGAGAGAAKAISVAFLAKIIVPMVVLGGAVGLANTFARAPRDVAPVGVLAHAVPVSAPSLAASAAPVSESKHEVDVGVPAVSIESLPSSSSASPALAAAPSPAALARAPASADAAAQEAALVGEIDAALRGGDAARAMRLVADHERLFPRGMLTQEREGARVVARCMRSARAAGAVGDASSAAFLAAHPRSPMRARIVAACGPSDRGAAADPKLEVTE